MTPSTPTLRVDTSTLNADYLGAAGKSPASSIRSRAMSALPSLRVSSVTSPSMEKAPLSPFLPKETGAGKGKIEMIKALSFQLDQIANRQKPPPVLDTVPDVNSASKKGPSIQAIGKSLSNDLTSFVNLEEADDDEDSFAFSPDNAADLTQNLRNLLLLSLDRGFNLFDEEYVVSELEKDTTKIKSSASPFRRRQRSQSVTRSRSPSPTTRRNPSHASGLLGRCLHLLQSLICEDCRYPISRPRPSFPSNALQAFCLDVAQLLTHIFEHSPGIMSQIAFTVLPAFSTFHAHMVPRLLQFFEECLLRELLSAACNFHQLRDFPSLKGKHPSLSSSLAFPFGLDSATPPIVAIQVEEAADETVSPEHGEWRRWLPMSEVDRRLTSSNSPAQAIDFYQMVSVVAPLLSAVLERLDLEDGSFADTHRFYRLFDLIVQLKPDSYIDLLQTVAYHAQPARRRGLAVIASYWPRSLGHFIVSRPFPVLGSPRVSAAFPGTSFSAPSRLYAHQFVPWRFSSHSRPIVFDGSSSGDCRVCSKPISGFGLFCPFCFCSVHYDCYDYPDGNLVVPYSMEADQRKQKVVVYRFCHIIPMRHSISEKALIKSGHSFRPVNLFSLSLCFSCRLPLWGSWEQALKCDSCHLFAHAVCMSSPGLDIDPCGTVLLHSRHMSITWDDLRSSFRDHYTDHQHHDISGDLRYEELTVLRDALSVQKSILINGITLGSIVVEGQDTLPPFEIDRMLENLETALSSPFLHLSATLEEFLQENQLHHSQHSVLYDWPTLIFVSSSLRTPPIDMHYPGEPSSSFLIAHPAPIPTNDASSNPCEVVTLAHLRDTLGLAFQMFSDASARLLLSHLQHTGFYDRLESSGKFQQSFSSPEKTLCVFPLPLGLDMSVDVEILVAAIEASLSDIDLSVNEAGFLLLTRRFWPNQMATAYALQRLAKAVVSWVVGEDDHIAIILRDYLSSGRPLPGVRAKQDKQPWPYDAAARAIHATSVNNGGDYVAHRRTLLQKYASVWLLALHDQDIPFYALTLYDTVTQLTEEASVSEQVELDKLPVYLADTSLRFIVRLSQAAVVFTVFDDLLLRWLEFTSDVWTGIPTLTRLLGRDSTVSGRSSIVRGINTTQAESSISAGMDPWSIIMRSALSSQATFQQAIQWLAMMATSGVDIPTAIFHQFADLSNRFALSVLDTLPLVQGVFSSVWLRSLGRQELHAVIAALHIRLTSDIVNDLRREGTPPETTMSFIRLSLAICLLVAGCEREKLLKTGIVLDSEVRDLPSRRNVSRGATDAADPVSLSTRFVASLGDYVGTGPEEASTLVGRFLYMFMKDCQLMESFEVDNFVLRNANVLSTSAWKFYDIQAASLSTIRPRILLHLLSVEPQPFQSLLDAELSTSKPWDERLKCLKQIFRIVLDVTNPEFSLDEKQWRTGVVFVFSRFFKAIWQDPQEEIRVSVDTWAQTLLPSHREQISLCWNEAMLKAPIADRASLVGFLIQLHPHFPTWQALTWKTLAETLMEDEGYLQSNGEDEDGPAAAHLSMYGLGSQERSTLKTTTLDKDAIALQVSTVILCIKALSAGTPVDPTTYLLVKLHLLRIMGYKSVESHPSPSGTTFYVAFENLGATPEFAWPCIDELISLLDSTATTSVSQAMFGPAQADDEPTYMLVGAAFADVLLAFVNEYGDCETLPYESAKILLQALIIVIYKHDFDGKILARLYNPLRRAARRALSFSLLDVPYDLRQLGVSVAYAFIKTRPGIAGAFVPDSIEVAAQLIVSLGQNREDILVQQAFTFLELTLSTYAESAILLALFKKRQERAIHSVLKTATLNVNVTTPAGDLQPLRDLLLKDTLLRISDPSLEVDLLQAVLWNLEVYLDMTHAQAIPAALMQHIGTSFNSITRRAADWPSDAFDPSVLLSMASTAILHNKANSRDLLLSTETLLRAALARFSISPFSLARILEVTLDSSRRNKASQSPAAPNDDRSMNPVSHAFLEIYSEALRGGTYMLSTTLKAMTEAVFEKFIEGDSKSGADAVMWANKLPVDGLTYLLTHGGTHTQAYDELDLDASLAVARLVLDGVEHSSDFFHAALLDSKAKLSLRSWNVLTLASLSRESAKTAHVLLDHFAAFAVAFHNALLKPGSGVVTTSPSTVNHCYTSIKLWLLLARKLSEDKAVVSDVSNSMTFFVWNDLWPPFLHLLTELTAGGQSGMNAAMITVAMSSVADLLLFLRDFHSVVFLEIAQQVASLRKLQSSLELSNTKVRYLTFLRDLQCRS
ncbi:hypothetical protein K488DRAFT_44141 [Vararia minispora EC-137]|uniref:Uncharacterized protein n=1 Tax=Vararia minispora EC-137 TaxID=1314806 RepID=A0ACB8QU89_9AGAM|nr:hypothetical protein K488DRAFT_44141 [Vararia minispora EC-137]